MKKLIIYPVLLALATVSVILTTVITKKVVTSHDPEKNDEEKINKPRKRGFSSNVIGIKAKKVLKKLRHPKKNVSTFREKASTN